MKTLAIPPQLANDLLWINRRTMFGHMEAFIAWGLTTLVGAFVGSYLAGYLRKKGENLATHEDIDKLVEQMKAVTQATKEIEAKISSDVWDRQKRWEMKREVLFSAAKTIADIDDALSSFATVFAYKQEPDNPASSEARLKTLSEARLKSSRKWLDAYAKYDETKLLVAIVCERDTKEAFDSLALVLSAMSKNISKSEWEIYHTSREDLARKLFAVLAAIRKELEIDKAG